MTTLKPGAVLVNDRILLRNRIAAWMMRGIVSARYCPE